MNLLLDSHVMLWFFGLGERLRPDIQRRIEEASMVFVSAASVWELAIKQNTGKLRIPNDLLEMIEAKHFKELRVTYTHARKVLILPPIHKDPFDRLLIAQALCEGLTIVTQDAHIALYPVNTLQA